MAKKSQKTASNVEVAAPATTPKSAIKGKREAGDANEKKLSNKKQKKDVGGAQGEIVKKGGGKKQKKKKVAPKTLKEEVVKKQESSDASSASDSEEEHEVVDAELGAAAKNGPLSDTKKTEESGSEDEDGNDSDEDDDDDAALSGDEVKEESSDDDAKSDDDDDDDASDDEMVEATAKPAAEKKKEAKPSSTKSKASPSNTLFIGNMAFSVEKADVENFFEDCGGVVDVRIGTRPDGSSKGFAHVEFATVEAAQKALDEKNGEDLEGRPVRLDFAAEKGAYTPQNNKDAGSNQKGPGSRSQTVYVRGFDKSVEENDIKDALREHFSSCGEITRISVPRDDDGCKGFAYIDFASSEGVSKAQDLDQSELNDYPLTVEEAKPRGDRGGGGGGGGRFKSERGGGRRGGGRFGGRGGGGRGGGGGGHGGGGRGRGGGGGRGRGRGRW